MTPRSRAGAWLAAALPLLSLLLLLAGVGEAAAAVPGALQLEGVLSASSGAPVVDGPYKLTFSFWDAEKDGTKLWSETDDVLIGGGRFTVALGQATPLDAKALAGGKVWLGVSVGIEPELPRRLVLATAFALRAAVAEGVECNGCLSAASAAFNYAASATKGGPAADLACTGCVSVAELAFDGDVDLGGNSLKAKNATLSGDVAAKTVTATSFVGDGSKLTGIAQPKGACKAGEAVVGIGSDGALQCKAFSAGLPADGLDEVSNGMLTTQFSEKAAITAPVAIPDNTGASATAALDLPDWGKAQGLTVQLELANTDLSTVAVVLLPPDDKKIGYTLCDPCGDKDAKSLKTAWSDKVAPKGGDLSTWLGKSPAGSWTLVVSDSSYCVKQAPGNSALCDLDAKTDGTIAAFAIEVATNSTQKVAAQGTLITNGGVDFAATGTKGFRFESATTAPIACNDKMIGYTYYDTAQGALLICDGKAFRVIAQITPGLSAGSPGDSCAAIHKAAPDLKTGTYWIDPDGTGAYQVTCDMDTDGGGWVRIAKDAKRFGASQESIDALASGTFKTLRAVHKSGFVACSCSSANAAAGWQACNPSHGDVFSFELLKNGGYVLKQSSWTTLPSECAKPSTLTGDLLCSVNFTVNVGDKLTPTWQEPSNNTSLSDNCGTQIIDLWAR